MPYSADYYLDNAQTLKLMSRYAEEILRLSSYFDFRPIDSEPFRVLQEIKFGLDEHALGQLSKAAERNEDKLVAEF